jgi:hypothetical protein
VVVDYYLSVTCVLQQDQTWVSRDRRRLHSTKRLYPSSVQKSTFSSCSFTVVAIMDSQPWWESVLKLWDVDL